MKNKKTMQLTLEQQKLFDNNIDLAQIKAYSWNYNSYSYYDSGDLLTFAYIGLVIAAQTYNPNRGCSFRTYASKVIQHEILHGVEQYNRIYRNEVPVEIYCDDIYEESFFKKDSFAEMTETNMVIDKYLSYCDPIDATIFREVIINDRSRTDVAAELNISIQTVSTKVKEMQKEFINFMNLQ